ncbi:MAG: phosphoribosylanthranilate isomerase [Anaerolineae bacterium]
MRFNLFPGRIKVCGITTLADAQAAVDCGVRTLGFVFHPKSPRAVTPREAREIIRYLPPGVACVGVFVDQPANRVRVVVEACGLTAVQGHGAEADAWLSAVGVPAIKALRVRSAADLVQLALYPSAAALLLDAWSPRAAGGTGERWDWSLAASLPPLKKPLILAGGLTPDNVAAAIRQVRPAAVDVSSGVEAAPGRKDPDKVRRFVAAAMEAFHDLDAT